jgi:hypothetical protein
MYRRDVNGRVSIKRLTDGTEQDLAVLYSATSFRVEVPGGVIDIRVGNRHADLDALLSELSFAEWAFITAWNPGSALLPPEQNAAAQVDLIRIVRDHSYHFYEGDGIPDQAGWAPERSVWIAGISRADAVEIGRRFGQNAIIVGAVGAPAELLFCH